MIKMMDFCPVNSDSAPAVTNIIHPSKIAHVLWKSPTSLCGHVQVLKPRLGFVVERIDPLHFLAGCRKR